MKVFIITGTLVAAMLLFAMPTSAADDDAPFCVVGNNVCYCVNTAQNCYDSQTGFGCRAAVGVSSNSMIGVICTPSIS